MRIAFVVERFFPLYGGVETRYLELGQNLVKLGHKVLVITGRGDITKKNPEPEKFRQFEEYKGIKIVRLFDYLSTKTNLVKRNPINGIRLGIFSRILLNKLIKKNLIDIVDISIFPHLHIPFIIYNLKIPAMLTWHEVWNNYWDKFGIYSKIGKFIERLNLSGQVSHIAVSNFTATRLQQLNLIHSNDISIIENAISRTLKNIKVRKVNHPSFLYVGRISKDKHVIDILIQSFSEILDQYPNAELHLVGDGPLSNNLTKIAKQITQIKYYGTIKRDVLFKLYKEVNVFVTATEREGSGISALEALGYYLPLVAIKFPLNAISHELIDHGINGYVCDVSEFTDYMIQAYERRDHLSQNIINKGSTLNWKDVANNLLEIYKTNIRL